jgi:ribosomal protein L24E
MPTALAACTSGCVALTLKAVRLSALMRGRLAVICDGCGQHLQDGTGAVRVTRHGTIHEYDSWECFQRSLDHNREVKCDD